MSIIGFIVLGDRTSHGGVVISGDPTWTIDGQPVARQGDKVTCPRCKRVSTIVSSRFPTVIDLGKPMAYDQDMTDCGAVIYSRHNNHAGYGIFFYSTKTFKTFRRMDQYVYSSAL